MRRKLRLFFKNFWQALFFIDGRELRLLLIVLLLALDLFIFITIERGISDALIKASPPYIRYPQNCVELFTKPLTYERIKYFFLPDIKQASPICQKAYTIIQSIKTDQNYAYFAKNYFQKRNELENLQRSIDTQMQRYSNTLLEKMAKEENGRLARQKQRFYKQLQRIEILKKELAAWPKAVHLTIVKDKLLPFIAQNKESILKQKGRYTFTYPFIYFYAMLKFLLPLLIVALFLFYKTRNAQTIKIKALHLLSAHLLFITAIPAIFYTLNLIYDIIPKKFLSIVLHKLYEWGVVYLGYYFLIFIAFIAIGYAIYRTLKRAPIVERAKRIKSMRFAKRKALQNSKCLQCGGRVNYYQDNFCQGCGNKLLINCLHCNNKIPKIALYCRHCGENL